MSVMQRELSVVAVPSGQGSDSLGSYALAHPMAGFECTATLAMSASLLMVYCAQLGTSPPGP